MSSSGVVKAVDVLKQCLRDLAARLPVVTSHCSTNEGLGDELPALTTTQIAALTPTLLSALGFSQPSAFRPFNFRR